MSPTTNSIVQWRPHLECNLRPGGWRVGIPPPPGVAVRMRCGPAESCLYFPLNGPLQLQTIQRTGPFIDQQHIHIFLSLPAVSSLLMETIQSAMLSAQEGQIKNEIFLCPEDHRSAISWGRALEERDQLEGEKRVQVQGTAGDELGVRGAPQALRPDLPPPTVSGADLHSPPSLHRLILAFETLSNQNPQFKGGDVSQRLVLLQCNVKTRTRPLY